MHDTIYEENDESNYVYFVKSGEIEVLFKVYNNYKRFPNIVNMTLKKYL